MSSTGSKPAPSPAPASARVLEWLQEAGLEEHWPAFARRNINEKQFLALSLRDYHAYGITSLHARQQLFALLSRLSSSSATGNSTIKRVAPVTPSVSSHTHNTSGASPSSQLRRSSSQPSKTQRQPRPLFPALKENNNSSCIRRSSAPLVDTTKKRSTSSPTVPLSNSNGTPPPSGGDIESEEEAEDYEDEQEEASPTAPTLTPRSLYSTSPPSAALLTSSPVVTSANTPSSTTAADVRVCVCVRKRPLLPKEINKKDKDIIRAESPTGSLQVLEPKIRVDMTKYTEVHKFVFDEVFSEVETNQEVYERTAKHLIAHVFRTRSRMTCFCYGQTGSGKTHTMMGKKNVPGLYALAVEDIFGTIESLGGARELQVQASLFEIYGNKLFDLLNDRKKIVARQNAKQEVCIVGLTEHLVETAQSTLALIERGNQTRSVAATGVHGDSSRGHAILQMAIKDKKGGFRGMFSFIDLAGSERGSDTGESDKQTRLEGAEINKSLLALKECIRALDKSKKHTPFRQSTLTQVLKDSFVGKNNRTVMIANIAPNSASAEHTLNTLRYADRVKELRGNSSRASTPTTHNTSSPPSSSPPTSPYTSPSPSPRPTRPTQQQAQSNKLAQKDSEEETNKQLVAWHRQHLNAMTSLLEKEAELLSAVEDMQRNGETVAWTHYKEALNNVLIDEALLFSNMPPSLSG
ncbi:SAM domain-containing protein [Balamuthia mandrillaris]